jgi:ADP-L-glycero-D-manno-heptose 6-epimerase
MNILITGNKGFIGQNAVERFSKKHKITVYDYNENTFPNLADIDVVMHFGAVSSTVERDVEKVLRQNFDFTVKLIRSCAFWRVKLQYSSSASVYGSGKEFKESSSVDPRSPYAWSKFLIERHSTHFYHETVLQGFRYFNVYGPHEDHKGDQASPYHKFEQQAINSGQIKVFENSEKYQRDFIHVNRVLDVHEKFLDIDECGIWNVGTGTPTSFLSVAKHVAEKTNAKIVEVPMPDNIRQNYQEYTCADLTKLNATLGIKND